MASLHRYVDKEGFYVRHSFASEGVLYHMVYQVSDPSEFELRGIGDGDDVPRELIHELRTSGVLFTRGQGVDGEELDESSESCGSPDRRWFRSAWSNVSDEARWLIIELFLGHPEITPDVMEGGDGLKFDIPNHLWPYIKQLLQIAKDTEGTNFLENLAKSLGVEGPLSEVARKRNYACWEQRAKKRGSLDGG